MFDVVESLKTGLDAGADRMRDAQSAVARANAGHNSRSTDAAMAQTAQAAIFEQALLSAIHERLNEIKAVTK